MTIPWYMNCPHKSDGWCMKCTVQLGDDYTAARRENEALTERLQRQADTILQLANENKKFREGIEEIVENDYDFEFIYRRLRDLIT